VAAVDKRQWLWLTQPDVAGKSTEPIELIRAKRAGHGGKKAAVVSRAPGCRGRAGAIVRLAHRGWVFAESRVTRGADFARLRAASRLLKKAMWTVFLVCMAVGFVRVSLAAPASIPVGSGVVQGRICETPEVLKKGYYRLNLSDATLNGEPVPGRLKLISRFATPPQYGQLVSASADVNLSEEEYRLNDRYRKIFAVAFAEGKRISSGNPRRISMGDCSIA
jgi:hypothetical protein